MAFHPYASASGFLSWRAARRLCCMFGRCSGLGIGGMRRRKMGRCSGDVAMGLLLMMGLG